MGFLDNVRAKVLDWIMSGLSASYRDRVDFIMDRREYRMGIQRKFIRVRPNQQDDNLIVNFVGLVVDRSISMLIGAGVDFEYGEDEQAQEFIDAVWEANKKPILLYRTALFGAEAGTCFVKIMPVEGGYRLIPIDSSFVEMDANPDDGEQVTRYTIQYKTVDENGREMARKEITELTEAGWLVSLYVSSQATGGKWLLEGDPQAWEWDFPPIVHWQNLPNTDALWGIPDITSDVMALQDRINFIASNISKVIRLYAHPARWGKMLGASSKIEIGPDEMPSFGSPDAVINQMEQLGDLAGSSNFLLTLRQSLMDITRTVDISSMADKIGALTNFGLHVLYQDALAKLDTKRALYGDALQEINQRLLILAGMEPVECEIVWGDALPENEPEEVTALQADLGMGLVDKQTASEMRGYDWETVQERLAQEQQAGDNIGAAILRAFDRNGGINEGTGPRGGGNRGNQASNLQRG